MKHEIITVLIALVVVGALILLTRNTEDRFFEEVAESEQEEKRKIENEINDQIRDSLTENTDRSDTDETSNNSEPAEIPTTGEITTPEKLSLNNYDLTVQEISNQTLNQEIIRESGIPFVFKDFKETTNFSQSLIPFDNILSGGPSIDGIPSLSHPSFEPILENKDDDDVLGVLIEGETETRWYPYTVLVWHEIVNDNIDGDNIAVIFCPLCGSAITFDRNYNGTVLELGVSGLLWESNMIFYDRQTFSLWSQARGQSVVGELAGVKLEHYPMRIINKADVVSEFPNAVSLTRKTGYIRNYGFYPYGDYDNNDTFVFPTSSFDGDFQAKELMLVTPFEDKSIALPFNDTSDLGTTREVNGTLITLVDKGNDVYLKANGKRLNSYVEMWFSWNIHHQEDGLLWK